MRRLSISLVTVALTAGMVGCGPTAVNLADPNLEAAIREAIAVPEGLIYPSDLGELASLNANYKGITDITGLEYRTGLTGLELSFNEISDISPLANLTSLRVLYLQDNQINDIEALANLTNLTELSLDGNEISDIGPLVNNEGLSTGDEVNLADNPLSSDSINVHIPELEARGVDVSY